MTGAPTSATTVTGGASPAGAGALPERPALAPDPLAGRGYPPPRLSRLQCAWRYGLAIASEVFAVGASVLLAHEQHWSATSVMGVGLVTLVLGVVAVVLMRERRRRPLLVSMLSSLLPALVGVVTLPSDWALVSLATRRRPKEVVPAALVYVASREAVLVNPVVKSGLSTASRTQLHLANVGVAVLEAALLVAVGFYVGARRDLIASLRDQVQSTERQQELAVLHAEAQERNRIAREMHDVVAHRISLVAMHAGALAFRQDLSPEQTHEIAQTIQENAAASLTELRSVLGQLRSPSDQPVPPLPDKPQPTLSDVGMLVRDARAAGMNVEYDDAVERPDLLPAQTGRHAYRIVQEALTNARKHAAGARVLVQVGGGPGSGLDVLVQNALRPGASMLPGSGAGLVGMHERAQMVGGQLTAGAQNGHFEVKVWFPW